MYREYGLKLPDGTQYLLELSRWVQAHSILAIVLTMALTAASVFAANGVLTVRWSRLRRNLVLLVLFGVPCVLFVVSWLGVLSTQSKLIEGLHK
jgi:type II secretory pathway component PulF